MAFVVTVDPNKIMEHFKGIMVLELLHPAAVAFPKLLVVLLYLHILTNKYERIAAKVLVVLISATWLSYTVAAMFQCTPFAFNWDKTVAGGKCFDVQVFANSSSVPNIFTDLAVLVLPLRTVWELKISIGRRVGLLLIFLTGSVYVFPSPAPTLRSFQLTKTQRHRRLYSPHHSLRKNPRRSRPSRRHNMEPRRARKLDHHRTRLVPAQRMRPLLQATLSHVRQSLAPPGIHHAHQVYVPARQVVHY